MGNIPNAHICCCDKQFSNRRMKDKLVHSSLVLGLILFGVSGLSVLAQAGQVALIVSVIFPGFAFGVVLITVNNDSGAINKITLLLMSTGIYILCIYLVDLRSNDKFIGPLRLLLASILGSVLLSNSYWILAKRIFTVQKCLILPVVVGITASMASCLSMYFFYLDDYYERYLEQTLTWIGLLSIFPIWMTLFSMNIVKLTPRVAPEPCKNVKI
jgi:hypothetical protein